MKGNRASPSSRCARCTVIPAYIWGTPETNVIWKGLLTPSRAHILFGPPLDLSDLIAQGRPNKVMVANVTQRMMSAIRDLQRQAQGESGRRPP